jgi:CheY-like chemotaxis protein/two-component sensor histidine kinase
MLISSAGNSQASFDESIRIRFEKDDLLKELEQEQRTVTTALQAAEAANRSKSFFMAAASHDLRQPLYAATILHDALALHDLEPAAAKLVEQQGKALRVAGDLFDNLLDLSRFESGVIKPVLTEVHLTPVLRELETEFLPQCEAKGLWLRVQANDVTVISDYNLLTRTLRNLLSNAIRYTAAGGIVLTSVERGAHAVVSVKDTGIGIAPDDRDRDRVFKEFVQLDNPQRSRDRGVGLGLAIVRHIAVLLGHEVQLESTPGAGTEMSIRMPRSETALAPAHPGNGELATEVELAGMKVWIVEDDDLVREALSAYFMKLGCLHRVAGSRADLEALELQEGWPDFVILDDMLGGEETGLDLARWLASRMSPERLLLTTGNADSVRWRELNESGFSVARKPLSASMLQEWLGAQLRKV